ncbi:MAG: PAS domain S-box protein [Verrucomicrobia bacterium]|nr:PAS domain S-box protein [Verrucomicrobiota bacterium]MDE3098174.1 PAS domain S-box protein [Verrucomicrobiota bacterium]
MMGSLHVLIVEDSENDTTLLLEELKRTGLTAVHERVQDAKSFAAALDRRAWDAIISDYAMPDFSGPDALRLLRARKMDVPFIVVSGTYGEEAAVGMMKAGASDYVVKNNLSRLAPAIEREIEAAAARHARARAESAMQFLAAIVESTDDAVYGVSLDGTIASWNKAAARIFGHQAVEIIGRSEAQLFPPDRQDELIVHMENIKYGKAAGPRETLRMRKDGRFIPVSITVSPVKNADGTVIGASAVVRDITRRKREERERTELIRELTDALKQVKKLSGLLPICASCKRIRDDRGYWQQLESYISEHSEAVWTHGICPECFKKCTEGAKARAA